MGSIAELHYEHQLAYERAMDLYLSYVEFIDGLTGNKEESNSGDLQEREVRSDESGDVQEERAVGSSSLG